MVAGAIGPADSFAAERLEPVSFDPEIPMNIYDLASSTNPR
jgi:hypothetical protein